MKVHYLSMILALTFCASPIYAQAKKKNTAKNALPRIGSRVVIRDFDDPTTRMIGSVYGFKDNRDVLDVLLFAAGNDHLMMSRYMEQQRMVKLNPGWSGTVLGIQQETCNISDPTGGPVVHSPEAIDKYMLLYGVRDINRYITIGPPMVQLKMIDGAWKGRIILVPIAYLASPDK
jgi:hypothetical protein